MGQIFSQLTKQGSSLQDPSGQTTAVGDPNKILGATSQMMQGRASQTPQAFTDPSNPFASPNQPPLPRIGQASPQEAASLGATPGGANAMSPALTKGGKLATILSSGLQGALAGRAKSEETVAATGGRRSGGVGMGFEAGYELPWQREQKQLGLQQQAAQVEATKAQSQMINTPSGPMPAWLAKAILPASIKGGAEVQSAGIGAQSRQNVAQGQQQSQEKIHRYQPIPGVGMFDSQTRQVMPGTEQGITITPEIAKDHNLPDEFIGKPMKISDLNGMMRFENQQQSPMMTAQGPIVIDKKTKQATPVSGPGGQTFSPPSLAAPREVGDVNNPGQTVNVPAGQSFGKPGVQSASVQVPKKALGAEVPSKIGDIKVGFTTAISHADMLRQAAKALNNGDQRTLAGLSNRAQTEFGDSDLTNFESIANAYNHEVTNVIAKGHITDSEVGTGNRTLPSNANYATIDRVLSSYQALMKSKMDNLNKQTTAAVNKSQPKSKNNDPLGIRP
jgi:hypothetical protein